MLLQLWQGALALISVQRCALCSAACGLPAPNPSAPVSACAAITEPALCGGCVEALSLPPAGLRGEDPLPWRALGSYEARLRGVLLAQRPQPQPPLIRSLATLLHARCADRLPGALLVPIPGWRRGGNPLPRLLSRELVRLCGARSAAAPELLRRCRATVGQHHLNRRQRLANQRGSFACGAPGRSPVWLVDDILTTGATAMAAAETLQAAGWKVRGLLCLGRTPLGGAGCDLRSMGRSGDAPG
ncbi:MAG: hypothetical protein RLZZ219_954 [Cyanobacteriota bacterium]|jgi:predicted amidophosphoribosyltransferase